MGLLDLFRSKKDAPPPQPSAVEAPYGWDALTAAFEARYPDQKNPAHRAPKIHRMHDLSDNAAAFDGMSAYDAGDFWHFVTFGLSELYGKENHDADVSGFGYELTFRLPKRTDFPPLWAFDFLEAIGKQVWRGATFAPGHTISTGPIDGRAETAQNAVLIVRDPAFADGVDTPNGRVDLLLLVGVEDVYRQRVIEAHDADNADGWEAAVVGELRAYNAEVVTPIATQGAWGE